MTDESPPKYEDVAQNQNDIVTLIIDPTQSSPSAPLQDEEDEDENDSADDALIRRLDATVQLSDILKFSLGSTTSEGISRRILLDGDRYEFFIRDQMEFLVAKCTVSGKNGNTIIVAYGATEKTFLELITEKRIHNVNTVFKVNHFDVLLGSISIDKSSLDLLEVKNNFEKSIYTITTHKFQETADINITKDAITVPVCRIHINPPRYLFTSRLSFVASISLSNCNTIEKCLFMSVAIAYMISRNQLLKQEQEQCSVSHNLRDILMSHNLPPRTAATTWTPKKFNSPVNNINLSDTTTTTTTSVILNTTQPNNEVVQLTNESQEQEEFPTSLFFIFLILIIYCIVIYIFRDFFRNNLNIVVVVLIIVFIIISLLSLVKCINQVRKG